jgi:tetratricopeptide (TPR) repeat protein
MKNLRFIFVATVALLVSNVGLAQGRYGKDSADCVKNLSFYRDYSRQNNFKEALPFWREAARLCPPTASMNFFIDGVKIMKYVIDNTNDPNLRQQRVDTLLSLYDQRLEHYPKVDKGSVYTFKAFDVQTYMPNDQAAIYKAFEDAVRAGRERTAPHTIIVAMQSAVDAFKEQIITADQLIAHYDMLSEIADNQLRAKPSDEQVKMLSRDLENLFVTSGVATCENMVTMFESEFKKHPNDKELIVRIVQMMSMNDCTTNDLYYQAVEAYHKLDPSAGSAYALGRMYLAKGEPSKAVEYYKQAIDNSSISTEDKMKYLLEMGTICLKELNNPAQAVSAAKQVVALDSKNGKAYLLMGSIWAAQKCGGNEIEQKANFWVSVDYFTKAKSVDASLAEEANRFINSYSQYFPQQSDAFMHDLLDGGTYTVNCNGMTEQTRVRTRK